MKTTMQHLPMESGQYGKAVFVKVKAQFGQELTVKVVSWIGRYPDRVKTQWGDILKRSASGLYDPA